MTHTRPLGPFAILYAPRTPVQLSEAEAKRIYNRDKKREQYARQAATRVNRYDSMCVKSDPDKKQRIQKSAI